MIKFSQVVPNIRYYVFMQKWDDGWSLTSATGTTEKYWTGGSQFYLCQSLDEAKEQFRSLFNKDRSYIVPVMLLDSGEWI